MSLSRKDIAATILVAMAAIVTYVWLQDFHLPFLNSWRIGTLALFLVGIGACITIGADVVPARNWWTVVATTLGSLAFILAALGLIFGSEVIFLTLAADIATLWLVATTHHLLNTGGHHEPTVYYRRGQDSW